MFGAEDFLNKKNKFKVVLKYKREDEAYLMSNIGVQAFNFDSLQETITFESSNYSWVIDFVIELKDKVEIIEPISLVEDVKEVIKKMNKIYF